MKSLAESIFDKENVTKELTFGDKFKPCYINVFENGAWLPLDKIANMFVMSKLKKAGDPMNIDHLMRYNDWGSKKGKEALELIIGLVATLPLKQEVIEKEYWSRIYDYDLTKTFKSLARSPYWNNGIAMELCKVGSSTDINIIKSNMSEHIQVTVTYEEK